MRFDLFYEFSVPPQLGRTEVDTLRALREEVRHAERCGFDTVWLAEHHFSPGYSHASAPDLVLASLAADTHRLRLGRAIVPLPYHHPVAVAEAIATLDLVSEGRVEFGFGRGFSPEEFAAFGIDMGESRTRTAEAFEIVRMALTTGVVRFQGRHFALEDVHITPTPIQRPPPLWMAAVSPESFELAARLGVGVLIGPFKPWFMIKHDIARYRAAWRAHQGERPCGPVGMTLGILCLPNGHEARALAGPAFEWFYGALFAQTAPVLRQLYETYDYYRSLGRLEFLLARTHSLTLLETLGMAVAGDPAHCARHMKRLARAGVDHVLMSIGAGAVDSTIVQRAMTTIAEHLMPGASCASS